jgi:hypothetical protein
MPDMHSHIHDLLVDERDKDVPGARSRLETLVQVCETAGEESGPSGLEIQHGAVLADEARAAACSMCA